jgi:hypothetical protein
MTAYISKKRSLSECHSDEPMCIDLSNFDVGTSRRSRVRLFTVDDIANSLSSCSVDAASCSVDMVPQCLFSRIDDFRNVLQRDVENPDTYQSSLLRDACVQSVDDLISVYNSWTDDSIVADMLDAVMMDYEYGCESIDSSAACAGLFGALSRGVFTLDDFLAVNLWVRILERAEVAFGASACTVALLNEHRGVDISHLELMWYFEDDSSLQNTYVDAVNLCGRMRSCFDV